MKVLLGDDDRVLADVTAFTLRREGFQVIQAHDGEEVLFSWKQNEPDLILLDVNMPEMDGFSVCRELRSISNVPIIFLTVRDDDEDIIKGLGIGADDYIVKPFSPKQLVARIQAVLRRAGINNKSNCVGQTGKFILDIFRRELLIEDEPIIQLTRLECRLLHHLMVNQGRVVPTEEIIDHVWGGESCDQDTLRQLVKRLRAKLAECALGHECIQNIPAMGYEFQLEINS
jgi:DNA-binding response OmpR family regulator